MDKLPVRMGIELTYMSESNFKEYELEWELKGSLKKAKLDYHQIHLDTYPNAIEISTPPFKSLRSVRNWYNRFSPIIRKYKLRATYSQFRKKRSIWEESGGGHIHTEIPDIDEASKNIYILNMMRYVTANPWLTWVFDEFCTTTDSMSLLSEIPRTEDIFKALFSTNLTDNNIANILIGIRNISTIISKRYAVAYRYRTVELRFFNSPIDLPQLEDHIKIASSIVKENLKLAITGTLINIPYFGIYDWIEKNLDISEINVVDISHNKALVKKVKEIFENFIKENRITLNKPVNFYMKNLRERIREQVMLI